MSHTLYLLLTQVRKALVNPESVVSLREVAYDIRRIPYSDDAEGVVLGAVADYMDRYSAAVETQRKLDAGAA